MPSSFSSSGLGVHFRFFFVVDIRFLYGLVGVRLGAAAKARPAFMCVRGGHDEFFAAACGE